MKEQIEEMVDDLMACHTEFYENGELYTDYTDMAENMIAKGWSKQEWISVEDRRPKEFVSVLGYMTDAECFPPVRECYMVGRVFFFPALKDVRPVSHWMPFPEPPKMKGSAE